MLLVIPLAVQVQSAALAVGQLAADLLISDGAFGEVPHTLQQIPVLSDMQYGSVMYGGTSWFSSALYQATYSSAVAEG